MKIAIFTTCYNGLTILKPFLKYHETFCDKIVVYDNGSNDGSCELVEAHPFAELIHFDDIMDCVSMSNNCWKPFREYDWIIYCDTDEFLYVKTGIVEFLEQKKKEGITVMKPQGWTIADDHLPIDGVDWFEQYPRGFPFYPMDKPVIFNPHEIIERNAGDGNHKCEPTGNVKWYESTGDLKLLHFRHLSYDYFKEQSKKNYERLKDLPGNRAVNYTIPYSEEEKQQHNDSLKNMQFY